MTIEQALLEALKTRAHGPIAHEFLSQSVGALVQDLPLPVVEEQNSLIDVLQMLKHHRSGAVLVTGSGGALTGIFSERDWVCKVADTVHLAQAPVVSFMTKDPHTVAPSDHLAYALSLMSLGGFRHLPIVQDGMILGLLTVKNILDELVKGMVASE